MSTDESAVVDAMAHLAAAPLVTGRYQTWRPADGPPIRTTVGYPRFWRHGPMYQAKEITPYGVFGRGLDPITARGAYRERLDRHTVPIVAGLVDLAHRHPGQGLCILCFEDVHAGASCHRRWFAEWMEERYGLAVPELPPAQRQLPL